jgi:hypothetical protein
MVESTEPHKEDISSTVMIKKNQDPKTLFKDIPKPPKMPQTMKCIYSKKNNGQKKKKNIWMDRSIIMHRVGIQMGIQYIHLITNNTFPV